MLPRPRRLAALLRRLFQPGCKRNCAPWVLWGQKPAMAALPDRTARTVRRALRLASAL